MYLGLEVVASHIGTSYPGDTTLELVYAFLQLRTGLSPFIALLSRRLLHWWLRSMMTVQNTTCPLLFQIKDSVCPKRFSVALTNRISFDFFSTGYWDVSLPRVVNPYGLYSEVAFGNLWFKDYVHLARAYRSLSRPSSTIEPSYPPCNIVGIS